MKKRSRPHTNNHITIVDVAEKAGVSYSTVSRVLNDEIYVKEATRKRVTDAIEKLGYVANQQARSLRGSKTHTIGLIVNGLGTEYTGAIVRGVDSQLVDSGYDLMVYTTSSREQKEVTYVAMMAQGMVDGLLLVLPRSPELYLDGLRQQEFPHVVIDEAIEDKASIAVLSDNFQGAFDATSYLLEAGHRDIAHIRGNIVTRAAVDRYSGYLAACATYDVEPPQCFVLDGDYFQPSGYQAAKSLLTQTKRPTAIVAGNDLMAIGVMEAATELGLSIPADLSIIGFDDIFQSIAVRPMLTTVRQPLEEMGRIGAQMVINQIDRPDSEQQRVVLPTQLILRDSSGKRT